VSTSLAVTAAETRSDATQGVFGYMAFYADFGEHEHIFSPVSVWAFCTSRIALTLGADVAEEVGAEEQGRVLATFSRGKEDRPKRSFR
jgi:hypothetical protein